MFAAGCDYAGLGNQLSDRPLRTILGVYPGAEPWRSRLDAFEQWLGRRHAVLVLYADASGSPASVGRFIDGPMTRAWASGHIPMVTWEPRPRTPAERRNGIVPTIRDGGYEEVLDRWADRLAAWVHESDTRRFYFRPLPEMNRPGLPWGDASPVAYRDAWIHLYERFAQTGLSANRLRWLWNPNATDVDTPRAETYYPGDQHVDWVGVDGYNVGDTASWSTWQTPEDVFGSMMKRVRKLTSKPVGIPEFATTSLRAGRYQPAAKAKWIREAFAYVQRERIRMACWFNIDKETDWAVFGGARGTDSYRGPDHTRHVYRSYRRAANRKYVLGAGSTANGVLSDAAFAGNT